jgi:4-amino-4-deoxy-L-arabinose transferase-like glycosyltransferase
VNDVAAPAVAPHRASALGPAFWCLLIGVVCIWFLTLDARHLLKSDEGRYAEIAREMVASGDWVTVRYNGLKYFEKPPFHLWMTALAFKAFGIGEWQARLWVALSGAAGIVVFAFAAERWFGSRVGLLTALVLLATPAWILGGHFNSLDMSVSGALACVLAGVLLAQHPQTQGRRRQGWMLFAWSAVAVAVLTKGLIGLVLPGLTLIVYSLLARDRQIWRRLSLGTGVLLMLAITLPWFVLVSLRNPEFPRFFFIHEHWQRYTSIVHHRDAPVWYFVPVLVAGFLPWTGLAWHMGTIIGRERGAEGLRPTLLLAVWATTIFVFFSLSGSKLAGYILPVFPALAVLAALALEKIQAPTWNRYMLVLIALVSLGLLAAPFLSRLGSDATQSQEFRAYVPWAIGAGLVAFLGLGLALYKNHRGRMLQSVTAAGLAFYVAGTVALLGHESFGRASSGVDLVAPMQAVLTKDMPIYSVRMLDHTVPFYLRRTTIMVETPDELEFGTQQEPRKWLPTLAAFTSAWTSPRRALAIMSHDTYTTLSEEHVFMVPIAEDARRVVVANFAKAPA